MPTRPLDPYPKPLLYCTLSPSLSLSLRADIMKPENPACSVHRCWFLLQQVAELICIQDEYLGAAGPKKWLHGMDSGIGERARPAPSQKTPLPPDGGELVELLWRDGAVVARHLHRAAFGRGPSGGEDNNTTTGASGVTVEAAWLPDGDGYARLWHHNVEGRVVDGDTAASACGPPPASTSTSTSGEVGSNFCGSNAVTAAAAPALLRVDGDDDIEPGTSSVPSGRSESGSGSGRSGSALLKRTRDDEFDASAAIARARRRSSRRRSAEVHNLSERRRRDRINEKMRALQELVPHCNKADKASVLDEAIDYLKSLQMQVQVMWMTTGAAAPMLMLPAGAHRLVSPPDGHGLRPTTHDASFQSGDESAALRREQP